MPPEYIDEKFCNLKHKELHEQCELRHREVDGVKEEMKALRECVSRKFNGLNKWMFGLLGAIIVDLVLRLVKGV